MGLKAGTNTHFPFISAAKEANDSASYVKLHHPDARNQSREYRTPLLVRHVTFAQARALRGASLETVSVGKIYTFGKI